MFPNVFVTHFLDVDLSSRPSGEAKGHHTARRYWPLSMNLQAVSVNLSVAEIAPSAAVTVIWEYSWDGVNWFSGSDVVSQKTAAGQHTGFLTIGGQAAPLGRLRVEVQHTGSSSMVDAKISLRCLYLMKG